MPLCVCGKQNVEFGRFCTVCGTKQSNSSAPSSGKPCPSCGENMPANAKFCTSCGNNLTSKNLPSSGTPPRSGNSTPTPSQHSHKSSAPATPTAPKPTPPKPTISSNPPTPKPTISSNPPIPSPKPSPPTTPTTAKPSVPTPPTRPASGTRNAPKPTLTSSTGKICSSCSKHNAESVKFCTACGKPFASNSAPTTPQQPTSGFISCGKCNEKNSTQVKFCVKCGTGLTNTNNQNTPNSQSASKPPPLRPKASIVDLRSGNTSEPVAKCTQCGAMKRTKFCTRCGFNPEATNHNFNSSSNGTLNSSSNQDSEMRKMAQRLKDIERENQRLRQLEEDNEQMRKRLLQSTPAFTETFSRDFNFFSSFLSSSSSSQNSQTSTSSEPSTTSSKKSGSLFKFNSKKEKKEKPPKEAPKERESRRSDYNLHTESPSLSSSTSSVSSDPPSEAPQRDWKTRYDSLKRDPKQKPSEKPSEPEPSPETPSEAPQRDWKTRYDSLKKDPKTKSTSPNPTTNSTNPTTNPTNPSTNSTNPTTNSTNPSDSPPENQTTPEPQVRDWKTRYDSRKSDLSSYRDSYVSSGQTNASNEASDNRDSRSFTEGSLKRNWKNKYDSMKGRRGTNTGEKPDVNLDELADLISPVDFSTSTPDEVTRRGSVSIPETGRRSGRKVVNEWAQGERETMKTLTDLRLKVIYELRITESEYVKDLGIITNVFMGILRERDYCTKDEFNCIFSNLEEIRSINEELFEQLKKTTDAGEIAKIFIDFAESLKPYSTYCINQNLSTETIIRLREKKDKKFNGFLEYCLARPECENIDFNSYMIKPIQRICKYPLLLNEIYKQTPSTAPEHKLLQQAFSKITEIVTLINERKRSGEEVLKVAELAKSITADFELSLATPNRKLVREGEISINEEGKIKKGLYLFLFNDLLLITNKKSKIYKVTHHMDLSTAIIRFFPTSEKPMFEVIPYPSAKPIGLIFESNDELYSLMEEIQNGIDSCNPRSHSSSPPPPSSSSSKQSVQFHCTYHEERTITMQLGQINFRALEKAILSAYQVPSITIFWGEYLISDDTSLECVFSEGIQDYYLLCYDSY